MVKHLVNMETGCQCQLSLESPGKSSRKDCLDQAGPWACLSELSVTVIEEGRPDLFLGRDPGLYKRRKAS